MKEDSPVEKRILKAGYLIFGVVFAGATMMAGCFYYLYKFLQSHQ